MKKVLMMLCAALVTLASCSKEAAEPQPQEQKKQDRPSTPVRLTVSATLDQPEFRELDHKFDGNKLKPILEGKTKVKVNVYIWDADDNNPRVIYANDMEWDVRPDGKTLYFDGVFSLTPGAGGFYPDRNYRLTAIVNGTASHNDGHDLFSPEDFAQPYLPTKKFAANVPYALRTKLTLTKGRHYLYGEPLLLNTDLPEEERKFKPEGFLFRYKVKNDLGRPVKMTKVFVRRRATGDIIIGAWRYPFNEAVRKFERPPYQYLAFDYGGSHENPIALATPITLAAGATTEQEFLYWIPSTYSLMCPDIEIEDPGFIYHTTMKLTKKTLEEYEEGKIYRATLVLRKLHNPLEYIAEYPMNTDGTEMMTSRPQDYTPPFTSGKFKSYAGVGYFNKAEAQARFTTPKQYPGGNGHTWHLPSEAELRSIFGSIGEFQYSKYHVDGFGVRELVQIGQHYKGLVNSYYNVTSNGATVGLRFTYQNGIWYPASRDIEDVYDPLSYFNNLSDEEMYYRRKTTTPEYPLEISNRRLFAFRYKYNDADRTLSVTVKYVGYNEGREGRIDFEYKSDAWWNDESMTRTFPAYGVDTNDNDYNYDPAKRLYSQYPSAGGMRTSGPASLIFNTQNPLKMLISTASKQPEWKMPVYLFRTIND